MDKTQAMRIFNPIEISGCGCELLKTVSTRISLHFP